MQEILSVAHDVTVFRDGRSVKTLVDASPTEDEVIALMTGKALASTLEAHTPDASRRMGRATRSRS